MSTPKRGEIYTFQFDNPTPKSGHEQGNFRPGLIISPEAYNQIGLAIVIPITNQAKGYPFEVPVPPGSGTTGVMLVDQVRVADWVSRKAVFKGSVDKATLDLVVSKLKTLIE